VKHFKDRKRNDFFPGVFVGGIERINITRKESHGQIITPNIEVIKKKICSSFLIFMRMATDNYYCGEKIIINTKSPRKCPPGLDDR
jgi:hypothetical protein